MKRALVALALLALAIPAAPAAADAVSTNWAGFVAIPRPRGPRFFTAISGTWTEPTVTCSGPASASAFWVGLGGDSETARGLEQIGTDADCERGGKPAYYAWYELIPAESVPVRIAIHPGDTIHAFVSVRRHEVTLRLTDETTHRTFRARRYDHHIDLSSAEWIVEAPTTCGRGTRCSPTELSDFGAVDFLTANATVARRTDSIDSRRWRAGAVEMQQAPVGRRHAGEPLTFLSATPTAHPTRGGAFSVEWHSRTAPEGGPEARNRSHNA